MRKAEIVMIISDKTKIDKENTLTIIEAFMEVVKGSLANGNNVYLRGFGSFIIKTRAERPGRNITKNTALIITAHNIPFFKPAEIFKEGIKIKLPI